MIFGVFNEDNHWELTVWFPRDGTILYLNPLGELDYRTKTNCRILQDIFKAQSPWGSLKQNRSNMENYYLHHSKQMDSVSCGIFVMKVNQKIQFCFTKQWIQKI